MMIHKFGSKLNLFIEINKTENFQSKKGGMAHTNLLEISNGELNKRTSMISYRIFKQKLHLYYEGETGVIV